MTEFCKLADELTHGEPGVAQQVIDLVVGKGGMQRVMELMDQPLDGLSDAQLGRIFSL